MNLEKASKRDGKRKNPKPVGKTKADIEALKKKKLEKMISRKRKKQRDNKYIQ